jgi:hypothetical protein
MKGSGDGDCTQMGEGGVIGRGESPSGGGDGDPARSREVVTRVGETT